MAIAKVTSGVTNVTPVWFCKWFDYIIKYLQFEFVVLSVMLKFCLLLFIGEPCLTLTVTRVIRNSYYKNSIISQNLNKLLKYNYKIKILKI